MTACLAILLASLSQVWPFGDAEERSSETVISRAAERYPTARYLWGVGESSQGAEAAELRARARVAEQLGLTITSSLTTRMEEHRHDDKGDLSSQVVWEARKEARFDNAQLIRCEPAQRAGEGWMVVAWLPRADAVAGLVRQYEDSARRFRERTREALNAGSLDDFSAAWQESRRLGLWLREHEARTVSLARDLHAASASSPIPAYERDMELFDRLDAQRRHRLGEVRMAVAGDTAGAFRSRAERLVREAGLSKALRPAPWELSLDWERTESESPIGEIMRCRLVPLLTLRRDGAVLVSRPVPQAAGEGFGVRDPVTACAQARAKADGTELEAQLDALLRGVFPIP